MKKEVREGYKMTELGEIPEEWEILSIKDLFVFKNGLNKEKEYFGKGTKIINYTDVYKNRGLTNSMVKGLVEVTDKEISQFNTKKGDVFFTRTSETIDEIGMTSVLLEDIEDAVFSGFVLRARSKNNKLDLNFKKYCFSSYSVRKEITRKSSYTTRALTSGTLLNDVKIMVPTKEEQEKIASILSTVDEQIDNTEKLIQKNQELKKGLMQQLLTKGIGHTKFKKTEIGEIPEAWEVKILSSIIDKDRKITYGIVQPGEYDKNGVYVIRAKDYSFGWVDNKEIFKSNKEIEKSYSRARVEVGDVLLTIVGSVGNLAIVPKRLDGANITQQTARLACDNERINNIYLYNFLKSKVAIKEINKYTKSGVQPSLNLSDVEKFKIAIPFIQEQEQIALILSAVDKNIEGYKVKKQKLEELKKGLMQQLLSGKIRVINLKGEI